MKPPLTIVVSFAREPKGGRMGARGWLVFFGAVAVALLLVVLGWAAVVRGRIHRQLTSRSRRLHLAMSAVAGCGVA